MTFKKTVCGSKGGLVVQVGDKGTDNDSVLIRELAADNSSRAVKTGVKVDYVSINNTRRYIALASFSKIPLEKPKKNLISIVHRPISGVYKEICTISSDADITTDNGDDSIVWVGWHPASQNDSHLATLSAHGRLCLLHLNPDGTFEKECTLKVKNPSDFSLKCCSASFMANSSASLFASFTLFILLESAEVVAVSPLIPSEYVRFPDAVYNEEARLLQARLNDIVENSSEFASFEYADAVQSVETLEKMSGGSTIHCHGHVKTQGPFAVHPEPPEDMLNSAQEIHVLFVCRTLSIVTILCARGRLDVYALLDPLHPRWDNRGDSTDADFMSILYLVDSIQLESRINSASVVSAFETDMLIQSTNTCYHVSLLPLVKDLLGNNNIRFPSITKCNAMLVCGWYNDADVDGSLIAFDGTKEHKIGIPYSLSTLSVPPNAVPDLNPISPIALKPLNDTMSIFSGSLKSLPSLKHTIDDGKLSIGDLELLHQQLCKLTDAMTDTLASELKRVAKHITNLSLRTDMHSRILERSGDKDDHRSTIEHIQSKHEELKLRASRLMTAPTIEPAPKVRTELSIESLQTLQSKLLQKIKGRLY